MRTKFLTVLTLSFMLLLANGCSAEDGDNSSASEEITVEDNDNNSELAEPKERNYIEQNIVQNNK